MGLPGKCFYLGTAGATADTMARTIQDFFQSGWEPLVRGGIDGYNISETLIDKRCGLQWDRPPLGQVGPKRLCVPILSETEVPSVRRKGPAGSDKKYGMEFVVDPRQPTGRVCVVASTDTTKQIISVVPGDPAATATPSGSVLANYGKAIFGTSGAFDWEMHRDGSASLTDDGTTMWSKRTTLQISTTDAIVRPVDSNSSATITLRGTDALSGDSNGGDSLVRAGAKSGAGANGRLALQTGGGLSRFFINSDGTVTQAGDHTFTGTLTATADTLVGNARFNKTSQTATSAGNYAVAATIATVFVDANALTAAQNFDVTLPSAATYSARQITVKISVVGAVSSTITVKSSSGTVEGVAAGTGAPMDASARSRVTYQSDGTNWWAV